MRHVFFLIFFLICTGFFFRILIVRVDKTCDVIDLLPSDTVMILQWQKDIQQDVTNIFKRENINNIISHPFIHYTANTLGISLKKPNIFSSSSELIPILSNIFSIDNLKFDKIIFALLPDHNKIKKNSRLFSHQKLVIFFPISASEFSWQEKLAQTFGAVRFSYEKQYNEYTIRVFVLESGKNIFFCQHQNTLICSFFIENIIHCLDQPFNHTMHATKSLRDTPHGNMLQKYGKDAGLFVWLQSGLLPESLAMDHANAGSDFSVNPAVIAGGYTRTTEEEQFRLVIRSLPGQWHALSRQYGLVYSPQSSFFQQAQPKTLLHFWFNGLSPKFLRNLEHWWQDNKSAEGVESTLPFASAGDLTAPLLDVLGHQIELRIDKQQAEDSSSSSSFVASAQIQVRNSQQAGQLLDTILAALPKEKRMVEQTEMTSVLLANGLLRPSYALSGEHLVIADTADLLERALTETEIQSLGQEAQQLKILDPLDARQEKIECFFLFLKTRELSQQMLTVLQLLSMSPQADAKTKILSTQNRQQIQHIIIPFLANLHTIETMYLRASLSGDDLVFDLDMHHVNE